MKNNFTLDPDFKKNMALVLERTTRDVSQILAEKSREVIETTRTWDDWTTSDPTRDIVDTNEMNQSMTIEQVSSFLWRITWNTSYVIFVYFGHATPSGNRIPARRWVHIAIAENDFQAIVQKCFNRNFV